MRKPAVISHLIGIVLFFSLPLLFASSRDNFASAPDLFFSAPYWLFIFYFLCIYFFLFRVALPYLYAKKRFWLLFTVIVAIVVSTLYVKPFDGLMHHVRRGAAAEKLNYRQPPPNQQPTPGQLPPGPENRRYNPPFDIVSIFLLLMLFLIVIATDLVKRWRSTEQRMIQAEADKANAELSFLKAQINPHFLFNTLNNIYSLAVTKNDHAPDAIMKLSNIMRYVTDEVTETMVPLENEIECINNYISLQRLRLGEEVIIEFAVSGNMQASSIPPLVLMTFVENAFKHGVSNHQQTCIIIKVTANENYIHFFSQNNVFARTVSQERTGIGMENTKKRLQVLYPDRHLLKMEKTDTLYFVELILYS